MQPRLVRSRSEILANIRSIQDGLRSRESAYYLGIIQRGTCLVVTSVRGKAFFTPSRFIGYADNSPAKHEANEYRDGRDTNPAIARALHRNWSKSDPLDGQYRVFCTRLGIMPRDKGSYGRDRKFIDLRT